MKLRCTHNSIRIRIRKSELETLKQEGQIQESITFIPHQHILVFGLMLTHTEGATHLSATLDNPHQLMVCLPKKEAEQWLNTNLIGLETEYEVGEGERLHILVEKDFPCKDRIEEDKADFFESLAIQQEKNQC